MVEVNDHFHKYSSTFFITFVTLADHFLRIFVHYSNDVIVPIGLIY